MGINFALYYPSMEFRSISWLKGMLLFWDGIRRIVPESYTPNDDEEIKPFIDAGIIKSIDPGKDAAAIADEFTKKLDSLYKGAAALSWIEEPQGYEKHYRIHPDKVDARLRDVLSSKEITIATKDWLNVSEEFGRFYMFYLANSVAKKRGLAKITDSEEAWTASSYFDYEGELYSDMPFEETKQVVALMLRNFIPRNIGDIPADSIISFREKHIDERKKFIDSIKRYSKAISSIDDPQIIEDAVNEYKKDVEKSITDFKDSLRTLKVKSFIGIKMFAFPLAANVMNWLGAWNFEYQIISTVAGLAIGLLTSFVDYKEKRKKLVKESDFSYIYSMKGTFDNWHYGGVPLNYHLFRRIEEFVND